jgi:hypothetical protein
MNKFDSLMFQYYQVLNNAWKDEVKDAARKVITHLASIRSTDRIDDAFVENTMFLVTQSMGEEFAATITKPTQIFMEKCWQYGLGDAVGDYTGSISIGLFGTADDRLATLAARQHVFWVGKHFETDLQGKFQTILADALKAGMRKDELADVYKTQFKKLGRSDAYWQGMAEHTSLRIRGFSRLYGYQKAGARGYRLVNPMDDHTSDICRALVSQNKVYPLDEAIEIMEKSLAIDPQKVGLERAREELKALSPWVKAKDVIYNDDEEPIGVSGAHSPYPPFHFR